MSSILPTISIPLHADEHGTLYIAQTKVTFELVIYAFRTGDSPEHIQENYPVLSLSDIYSICSYYLQNQEMMDAYLKRQEDAEKRFMQEVDTRHPLSGKLRAKLLALK
jgi:uncharacterized protein (DUF433 family)